jgi:hypothetical protein
LEIHADFYKGFEGEPEIRFIYQKPDSQDVLLKVWIGYFDLLMSVVHPTTNGWSGLSYFYHFDKGWFEESPWEIKDISSVIVEFRSMDVSVLDQDSLNVWNHILKMFQSAQSLGGKIFIEYY